MRNPKWHRDEIILALDLYFKTEPGQIHARNPDVIELSEILNKLPIHDERPDHVKFRNANGVGLKLSNFLAIDPEYLGKGMTSFTTMSDYQEIEGLYFPFSMSQGVKGQPGAPMTIESIELNPEVAEGAFAFPELVVEEKE